MRMASRRVFLEGLNNAGAVEAGLECPKGVKIQYD
jgi:hypothetical protein